MFLVYQMKSAIVAHMDHNGFIYNALLSVNQAIKKLYAGNRARNLFQEMRYWDETIPKLGRLLDDELVLKQLFPSAMFELLKSDRSRRPRILDVGSGPFSLLGYAAHKGLAEVIAIDPLASFYQHVMAKNGMDYPVCVHAGTGESLASEFADSSFDIVYTSNALDHVSDIRATFGNMHKVLREGGYLFVESYVDEGKNNEYTSIHKYDLFIQNDKLMCREKSGDPIELAEDFPLQVVHSEVQAAGRRGGGLPYFAVDDKPWLSIAFLKRRREITMPGHNPVMPAPPAAASG